MNILIKEFIDSIDEEELYKLQYDLSKGSIALKKTVEEKIKEIENRKRKIKKYDYNLSIIFNSNFSVFVS